ncbi:MAG: hypothetical protein KDA85_01205 [Planctomycetaceae bacterium]|nr:hypothetical protein [Planctomycetaceae bacterium]
MKSTLLAIVVLWCTLAVEQAGPSPIVQHSLLIPVCCAVVFWLRNARGILLAGAALCVDWILHPHGIPLTAAVFPALSAGWVRLPDNSGQAGRTRRLTHRIPQPLRIPLLVTIGLLLQIIIEPQLVWPPDGVQLLLRQSELMSAAMIAIPLSGLLALALSLADELGLHSSLPQHRF